MLLNSTNIILPTNNELLEISKKFLKLKHLKPYFFNNYFTQISLLGCFPYCIWSFEPQDRIYRSREEIEAFYEYCIKLNSTIYFDFSNTQLKKEHFYDNYTNLFLSLSTKISTNAITKNNELKEYIKQHYKHINIVEEKITYLNSYCLNCEKCHTKKSIAKLNFERYIPLNCKNEISTFEDSKQQIDFIELKDIKFLKENGCTQFIIRAHEKDKYEFLESCLYYLIKEEFQNQVRLEILKQNFKSFI